MQSVCVCRGCGRTIETEFLYCPWCGISRLEYNTGEDLSPMLSKLEELQIQDKVKHIKRLDAELAELEKDLETLALSAEMHK
ncbi:MAG: hypothetical protein J6B81_01265 [Spirochaetaceae bacterium]|nr:hypothetical protein [Spirochaetaceae bacterium]